MEESTTVNPSPEEDVAEVTGAACARGVVKLWVSGDPNVTPLCRVSPVCCRVVLAVAGVLLLGAGAWFILPASVLALGSNSWPAWTAVTGRVFILLSCSNLSEDKVGPTDAGSEETLGVCGATRPTEVDGSLSVWMKKKGK